MRGRKAKGKRQSTTTLVQARPGRRRVVPAFGVAELRAYGRRDTERRRVFCLPDYECCDTHERLFSEAASQQANYADSQSWAESADGLLHLHRLQHAIVGIQRHRTAPKRRFEAVVRMPALVVFTSLGKKPRPFKRAQDTG